jgi:hypothetical protein
MKSVGLAVAVKGHGRHKQSLAFHSPWSAPGVVGKDQGLGLDDSVTLQPGTTSYAVGCNPVWIRVPTTSAYVVQVLHFLREI